MTITDLGRVGIGTTLPGALLEVNGAAVKPGGGLWSVASDERLKEIDSEFSRGLEDLVKLNAIAYHYRDGNELNLSSEERYIGVTAQNMAEAIPEAIVDHPSDFLHVNNEPLIWTLVNSIKELDAKNKEAERRNAELEERLARVESLLAGQQ